MIEVGAVHILFYLGVMMFAGMLGGKLIGYLGMPKVTGYLVAGLLIGPSVLNIVPKDVLASSNIITEVALAFIAFSIGGEFKISFLKKIGVKPVIITLFEALTATVLVTIGVYIISGDMAYSLLLGAIAAATAPAATLMVVKQYKASGPVTDMLIPVVAMDDAVSIIAFGICLAAAKMLTSKSDGNLILSLLKPFVEIILALLIGLILGFILSAVMRRIKGNGEKLACIIGFIFLGTGIASTLNVSSLLLCMAMGGILINTTAFAIKYMKMADDITPPIFLLFFVSSGADLNLSILPSIGVVGVVYIVVRVLGKMLGSFIGSLLAKEDKQVVKYLGPALIPQAGVAIGLSLVAMSVVPQHGDAIRAVILSGTLVYELIGPTVAKLTLKKAGEIQ